MIYLANQYHPYITWCDYVSYDHEDFVIQPIPFAREYFMQWFLPREFRWFFYVLFPFMCYYHQPGAPRIPRSKSKFQRQLESLDDDEPASVQEDLNAKEKQMEDTEE